MKDTQSIEGVVRALYEIISGPAGAARDWNRFRSLLFPGARLVRTFVGPEGKPEALAMEGEAYEANTADYFRSEPFYESEVASRVWSFGNIAHVLSVYESRHDPADAKPFKRGINSIQLFNDGHRWLVVSILWDYERPDNPIPTCLFQGR